ncbi:MAG: reverse transcriptase domain-containing protein [Woeseiaceae bacterium]
MSNRSFEQAFNAVFHDEQAFNEFCSLDINAEVEAFEVNSRTVYRTSDKFKKYLRFIDKVILRHLDKNERVVHSYLKEKSVLTAVKSHASSKCFFLTDIKDFFTSVKAQDVLRVLSRDKQRIPISDFDLYIDTIVKLTTFSGSIPVGFPTSPSLSNSFLMEFDAVLENYCSKRGFIYTRYSDDIIISGKSFDGFDKLESDVQAMLHEYASEELFLNAKKTHVTKIGNKVKILGLVITVDGRVTIDSKYKNTLESLLYFYINDKSKYTNLLEKTMHGKERSLFGLLHYVKSIDQAYLEKLQRKYGAYALSALMEDRWSDK